MYISSNFGASGSCFRKYYGITNTRTVRPLNCDLAFLVATFIVEKLCLPLLQA